MWRWMLTVLVTSACHRGESPSETQPPAAGVSTACTLEGPVSGRATVSGGMMVEENMAPSDEPKPVPAEVIATAEGFADVTTTADDEGNFTLDLDPEGEWTTTASYDQYGLDTGDGWQPINFTCTTDAPVVVCGTDLGDVMLGACITLD